MAAEVVSSMRGAKLQVDCSRVQSLVAGLSSGLRRDRRTKHHIRRILGEMRAHGFGFISKASSNSARGPVSVTLRLIKPVLRELQRQRVACECRVLRNSLVVFLMHVACAFSR